MSNYTILSQNKYDKAFSLNIRQAAQWLLDSSDFRTLPEKLLRHFKGTEEEMKAFLKEGFKPICTAPGEMDSIRKNIGNWFKRVPGIDDRTISREYGFEIAFILKLSLEDADWLLRDVCGESIHYRNLEEFVAAFALKKGLSYLEYRALRDRIHEAMKDQEELSDSEENYTPACQEAAQELTGEQELLQYVQEHRAEFGNYRNTAHEYFVGMLEVLQNEGTNASVEELVDQNLYRRFTGAKAKGKKFTGIQKSIKAGWPDEARISKMRSREIPVTRKVLILLFLASGGGLSLEYSDEYDDASSDADFQALFIQMNAMLVDCGFSELDPRVPFDWMTIFGMATGDIFDLDERFETVLSELYGND